MKNSKLFALLLFFTACSPVVKRDSFKTLDVSLSSTNAYLQMSKFASSVEYIPLGTDNATIIDELVRVVMIDDFIYVADKSSLYKLTLSGDIVKSICHQGNGPAEYVNISDFQLDEDGSVWVLSRNNKALYNYTWEDSLQRKINLDNWVEKIYLLGKDKMLLYAGNEKSKEYEHTLCLLDMKTETVANRSLLIDEYKSNYLHVKSENHFSRNAEQCFFYQMFNDTVYCLNDNGITTPEYILNMDGKNIPTSFYRHKYRDVMDFFQNLFKEDYAYGTGLFVKNDNAYLLSLYYSGHSYWCTINEKKSLISDILMDDMCLFNYKINLEDISYFVQPNNQIAIPLSPYLIMDYAEKELNDEQQAMLAAKIHYSGEDQNQVLLIVKM